MLVVKVAKFGEARRARGKSGLSFFQLPYKVVPTLGSLRTAVCRSRCGTVISSLTMSVTVKENASVLTSCALWLKGNTSTEFLLLEAPL